MSTNRGEGTSATRAEASRFGAAALGLLLGSALLVLYTAHGSMPENAIVLPGERDLQTTAWAPESWKFFTRSPQEEVIVAWVKDGDHLVSGFSPSASPKFLFGVDRTGRGQGMELALLLEGVPRASLHDCEEGTPDQCIVRLERALKVSNPTPNPTLCGFVGVSYQKPVPWAWARSKRPVVMPSRVLRLEVTC